MSNSSKKTDFVQGIRSLVDYHFRSYDEKEHADILGEMLFNGRIFSKEASNQAAEKITRTMTSCIFHAVALLKNIDMKAGSSNDNSIDEYGKIEKDSGLTSYPRGKSMLRPRHNVTRARNIANGLVKQLFTIDESSNELGENEPDQINFDPERLFRFMLNVFKFENKALQGNTAFGFAGDGAAVCTSTNTASQCLFGLKIVDTDAINPLTNKPLLCTEIVDEDGISRRSYCGAQSNVCCMVASAIMAKEKEAMESTGFKRLINFLKRLESEGIPANGDEPALPPQTGGLIGCGDLSFQQKMSCLGGACKVKQFFCTYCATESGDHDLLAYVTGSKRCAMCVRNDRERCTHVAVDDPPELKSKGKDLFAMLLDDFRTGQPNATAHEMLIQEPVECFVGYTEDGDKVWEMRRLQDSISEDGTEFTRPHLYDYSCNLIHTEESESVLQGSRVKFDPTADKKEECITNIEYVLGLNQARDDAFIMNVTVDLMLRGFKHADLPTDRQSLVLLLGDRLLLQRRVRLCKSLIQVNWLLVSSMPR